MISLLITTHERGEYLERSLQRLRILTQPDELIVVNDGGRDDCSAPVESFGADTGTSARVVYFDNPGLTTCSKARNFGVGQCSGDWIVTSEPELIFVTDAIAQFKRHIGDDPRGVVSAGSVYCEAEGGLPGRFAGDLNFSMPATSPIGWVTTYTALWARDWLLETPWDEGFPGAWGWEDVDLLRRLHARGVPQHIAPEIGVVHQAHPRIDDDGSANEAYLRSR